MFAAASFAPWLAGADWIAWIDNSGVVHSIINGGNKACDANLVIAKFWLFLAQFDMDFWGWTVHTKSNLADGATRDDTSFADRLNATWVSPRLSQFLQALWEGTQESHIFHLFGNTWSEG